MKLEKYQIEGAKFLAANKHALLADDMGLGKTAQAIEASSNLSFAIESLKEILVVCPASVKQHWNNEFEKWSVLFNSISIVEGRKFNIGVQPNIIIVNYELLLSDHIFDQLKDREWNVLICDEAHYLRSLTSKRSKRVLGKGGLVHNVEYKWMLTGTPIENRPVDLFPMLYTLAPDVLGEYNNYEKYVMRYCDGYYDHYTREPMPSGASHEAELGERLKKFMLRRTLEHELPKTKVQVISLKKNVKVLEAEKNMDGAIYHKPMAELGGLASLRQEVAMAKLPQVVQYIKDTLETVDKLVVFAYHRNVILALEKALEKYNPAKYYGGQTTKQKELAKGCFIKFKSCRVFIGQLQAVGTGTDGLQEVCHHMVFAEMDWLPLKQCIGRLKRKGQKNNVIAQILVTKDSLEEAMLYSVKNKSKSIDKIMGD